MEAIKNTVVSVIGKLEAKKRGVYAHNPEDLLKKLLTKKEAEHIKFNYFKKGILNLSVDSSSWLYSFSLRKEEFIAGLNKKSSEIKDIRFRIGEIK